MGELTQEKRKVTKILKPPEPAKRKAERLRVCAYCRVSTKQDEQRTSYDTQVRAYTEMISANPEWKLAGIYADWGISGTQSKKRPEFMRMLAECEAGNIDMVICKSISRFSRNTLDAVNYIRRLKEMGIRILFEKEGVDTDAVISEMLLSVLSAFAQEESHSHSENVKWGKRKRAMNGQPGLYPPYGYRKQGEDQMVIEPKEAEVVRWIFESYEHGMPIAEITATLLSNGTPAPRIDGGLTIDDERLREAIEYFRPRLLIIDPIQAYVENDSDLMSASKARRLMRRTGIWASKYECAIVVIGHMNKSGGQKDLYRGLGSIDLVASARSVLQVERSKHDEAIRIVRHVKSSSAPKGPDFSFEIRPESGFRWLEMGINEQGADAEPVPDLPKNKHELAAILITKTLEDGPVESTEIKKLMAEYRIGEKTMNDAKVALGIKPFRKMRKWYWQMEKETTDDLIGDGSNE